MSVLVALGWWFGLSLAGGVVLGRLLDQAARATTTVPAPAPAPVKITASPTAR